MKIELFGGRKEGRTGGEGEKSEKDKRGRSFFIEDITTKTSELSLL